MYPGIKKRLDKKSSALDILSSRYSCDYKPSDEQFYYSKLNFKVNKNLYQRIWFIMLARRPAPKPLSIFITATPAAQLFSIARSAERPPKDAP